MPDLTTVLAPGAGLVLYDPESGINNATWSCERHLSKARRKIGWID